MKIFALKNKLTKKLFVSTLILLLVSALFGLAGCSDKKEPAPKETAPKETAPKAADPMEALKGVQLNFATIGAGTGFYNFGIALSSIIEKNTPMLVTPLTVPGITAITESMKTKEAMIGIHASGEIAEAFSGIGMYQGKQMPYLRALQAGYDNFMGIVVPEDSKIKTFADLKGKRVVWDIIGSPAATTIAKSLLEFNGLDPNKDVITLKAQHTTQAYKDLAEGRADAVMWAFIAASVEEEARRLQPRFLPVNQKEYEFLQTKLAGLMLNEFPFDAQSLKKGVPVVGYTMTFVAREELEDNVAYTLVKTLGETYDQELKNKEWILQQFSPQRAVKKLGFPYHPGAVKYYKEAGLWNADMDAYQASLLKK